MAIACTGYRITAKTGHHRVSWEGAALALGKPARDLTDYFDTCRRKRNQIDYMRSDLATETEADEILARAMEFCELVETWISKHHENFRR